MEAVLEHEDFTRPSVAVERDASKVGDDESGIRCGLSSRLLTRRLEGDLDTIVEVALRRDPARRYGSADALAQDLDRHLQGLTIQARPSSFWYQLSKIVKRHKLTAAAILGIFLAAVGVAIAMSWQASVIARERDRADLERVRARQNLRFPGWPIRGGGSFRRRSECGSRLRIWPITEPLESKTPSLTSPKIQAALNDRIGQMYLNLGFYAKARPHLETAVQERQKLDDAHGLTESFRHLARLDRSEGSYDAAARSLEQALAILRRAPIEQMGEIAVAERELAIIYGEHGDYDAAEALLEASLERLREAFGPRSLEVAESLAGLADMNRAMSHYRRARSLLQQALDIRTELQGENHPKVAEILNNLGRVMRQHGEPKAAGKAFSRAIAIYESTLRPDHPALAGPIANRGVVFGILGDYDQAEKFLERALTIHYATFEGPHMKIAGALSNLAIVADLRGRHEQAIESYMQAASIYRELYGPDNEHIAGVDSNLATLYLEDGELELAQQYALRSLESYRKILGESHDLVGNGLITLGETTFRRGDVDTAGELLEQAVEILEQASEQHPNLAWALRWSGLVDLATDRHAAAAPKLKRALEIRNEHFHPLHVEVLESELDWAEWLLLTGSVDSARDLLLELKKRCTAASDDKLADADFASRLAKTHLLLADVARRTEPPGDSKGHLKQTVALLSEISRPSLAARIDLAQGLRQLGKHQRAQQVMRRLRQQGLRPPS